MKDRNLERDSKRVVSDIVDIVETLMDHISILEDEVEDLRLGLDETNNENSILKDRINELEEELNNIES